MNKGVSLLVAAWCLAGTSFAQQQLTDSLRIEDDNSDFTFSESQIDDDVETAQTVSAIVASKSDPYLSNVGYLFSPMRFKIRAYDNMYNQVYMNGLQLNDLELGRFSYGMIGGMNDATRNQEGVAGYEANNFGYTGVGGGTNINTRASQFAQGNKLSLSACNRNYLARAMYTHATGMNKNGWAFAGTVGYRWANEGVIEGTFYNSLAYFLAVEKRINDNHSLSLVTFGSPTERAQQGASTEEAYWLANSHYYNPYWGYQNGEKRNSRVVKDFEPTAILTWDWNKDNKKLVTSAGFKYSMYSNSRLVYSGNAYNPAPDYYKNFPSSIFDVYDPSINNSDFLNANPFLLDQYNDLVDYWTSSKANRQIQWDKLYEVNRINEGMGGETLYYVERNHNDQMVAALSSTFSQTINQHHNYVVGLSVNGTKGMHYKTMEDMLGGTRFTDVDNFAVRDYGAGSTEAQNDLNNPNRAIGVDDKFGYNYNIFVGKARLWGQYQYNDDPISVTLAGHIEGTTMEREGLMRNGRAADNSYGKSGAANFLGGGGKAVMAYRPNANQRWTFSVSVDGNAPLARNAFVAPRIQNNFVDHLTLEHVVGTELSYQFRAGNFMGKMTAYYTKFMNGVEQTAFYNDQESRFTYLTMSCIDRRHYGLEAAFKYEITSNLSVNLLGSIGEAEYINNPLAQVNYEGMTAATIKQLNTWKNPITGQDQQLRVIANEMHVGSTPLTAVSLGIDYNVNGWFLSANLNYYDRVYIGFSQYRRLSNVLTSYTATSINEKGEPVFDVSNAELNTSGGVLYNADGTYAGAVAPKQEKCKGGFMLDASVGKYIRLKHGRTLSVNLSLQNITNNTNLRTGGFEQNRDDFYETGEAKPYKFSKNSKYYYANAFNAFLNIAFRF